MVRRVAYALSVALCVAGFATAAHADPVVTYTWETLSSTGGTPFSLSFTVSGDVSFQADDSFAGLTYGEGPVPQVAYQFPSQLVSFDLYAGFRHLTLGSFLSPLNLRQSSFLGDNDIGQPKWIFDLTADTASETASLELSFEGQQSEIGSFF